MIMRVMYLLTFGVLYTLSLLPLRILYLLSDVLCLLAYRVVGYRRRLVRQHLRDSFPGRTDRQLAAIEHGFYAWFCDYIVETVKLFSMSPRQMRRRMVFKGTDKLSEAVDRGQSCGVYLGTSATGSGLPRYPCGCRPRGCVRRYTIP